MKARNLLIQAATKSQKKVKKTKILLSSERLEPFMLKTQSIAFQITVVFNDIDHLNGKDRRQLNPTSLYYFDNYLAELQSVNERH